MVARNNPIGWELVEGDANQLNIGGIFELAESAQLFTGNIYARRVEVLKSRAVMNASHDSIISFFMQGNTARMLQLSNKMGGREIHPLSAFVWPLYTSMV